MLREVHEQEIIEEVPEPIFAVSMILMTPVRPSAGGSPASSRRSGGLHSAMRSVSAHIRDTHGRKGVTFPEGVTSAVELDEGLYISRYMRIL